MDECAEIANGEVKNPDILNGAVTTNKLRDGSVGNADLGPDSVTGAKVLDDSLSGAKISESTLATVPSATQATNAEHVNGKTAAELEGARAYAVVRGCHTPHMSLSPALSSPSTTRSQRSRQSAQR